MNIISDMVVRGNRFVNNRGYRAYGLIFQSSDRSRLNNAQPRLGRHRRGMEPPDATERGFKDTVKANPGEFTTIRAQYDLPTGVTAPQTYVYHCHILEHEDNDMMRPFTVIP
jgi:FtsP/CotA-like multicopper oxidase with cupredoxin domain